MKYLGNPRMYCYQPNYFSMAFAFKMGEMTQERDRWLVWEEPIRWRMEDMVGKRHDNSGGLRWGPGGG
jgi:hypothetical protein